MLTLKNLDEVKIRMLYNDRLRRDFPPSELKRLSAILGMRQKGIYDVLGAYKDGKLAAYALMYRDDAVRVVLLDYLAVEPQLRGQGIGTELLKRLKAHYAETSDVLLIECERPKTAPDEMEARKRIRFYTNAGAQLTQVRMWLFEVEYSILVLPCRKEVQPRDWAQQMLSLYRQMLPSDLYEKNVRSIRS